MILVDGELWGTAREIADQLGHGVTIRAVRYWASDQGLRKARIADGHGRPQVRYPLGQASRIELEMRDRGSVRGRRS
ncbi:hypothetical protein AMIS_2590 [Actinoplanes missouriensis 431]|uniref:HTH merR-type domain-containing protein n=1 Tax=Actinoplanes missouriensis (strain ATCC 14538 / DSM 43046 / CBS 188.64 / JCM 3121 / NBRC 102363 / NCIMB 12654 / NRRL B-3342 / UNCC 431) TaxID=512565 RepID=I0GXJ2_ACTM4|nr:hypothetical protein [Actinoplanes missouriensis]KOX45271.1 hypothetical protein ADL19_23425 [Streptomyces purpurogeneiscleroticus]BAL85479.1 hypothetical protein AMIS_2590 [Actinoplanes missouriensis 431]